MVEDQVLFARSERQNVVGQVFHMVTWKLFGGVMNTNSAVLGDVHRKGYLAEAKGRGDWGSFLAQSRQVESYDLAFPQTALYFFWGYTARGLRTSRCRKRKSLVQNLRTTRDAYRFLAKQTNQLYIVDAAVVSAMLQTVQDNKLPSLISGSGRAQPYTRLAYGGEEALHIPRAVLKGLVRDTTLLRLFGLDHENYRAETGVHTLSFPLLFRQFFWDGVDVEQFTFKFKLNYLVHRDDLAEVKASLARQQARLNAETRELTSLQFALA